MIDLVVIGLRWLQFAGAATLFGLALFQLYAPTDEARPPLRRAGLISAILLLVSAPLGLLAQVVVMAGSLDQALDPAALDFVVRQTALGWAHVARGALALAAAAVLCARWRGRGPTLAVAALGLGACASFAWSGHAGATVGAVAPYHLVSDILHVAAAGAWLGALVAFVILLRRPGADRLAHAALAGFAGVGTGAVAVLAVTGLFNTFVLVGPARIATALDTAYGRLLFVKLALFGLMIGLAVANRYVLTPALGRARTEAETPAALRRLRLSLALETALGAAVLALVAAMGVLAPPAAL